MRAGPDGHRRRPDDHVRRVQHRQHGQAELPEHRVGDRVQVVHRRPMHHHRADHHDAGEPDQRQHPGGRGAERVGQPVRQAKAVNVRRPTREPTPITAPIGVHGQHAAECAQRVRRLQFGQHRCRVVDDGQRDRGDQQRTAQRRRDDPADDEPRRGCVGAGPTSPPRWCARCPTPSPAPAAAASRPARGRRWTPAPGAHPATCWRSRPSAPVMSLLAMSSCSSTPPR